jgi:outer membrane immunogenic protein
MPLFKSKKLHTRIPAGGSAVSISSIARVAAGALIISATSALAADLPSRKVAPVAPIVPSFTWTGFYIGADLGGSFGYAKDAVWYNGVNYGSKAYNSSGVVGGIHAGYNYQMGAVVLGAEADLWYNGVSTRTAWAGTGGATGTLKNELGWQGSIRARAGYAIDRALLFVTAGVAIAAPETTLSGTTGIGGLTVASSATRAGFTVGGGAEYAFTNNWIGKVEYRYADYGTKTIAGASAVQGAVKNAAQVNTITAGVSYKF